MRRNGESKKMTKTAAGSRRMLSLFALALAGVIAFISIAWACTQPNNGGQLVYGPNPPTDTSPLREGDSIFVDAVVEDLTPPNMMNVHLFSAFPLEPNSGSHSGNHLCHAGSTASVSNRDIGDMSRISSSAPQAFGGAAAIPLGIVSNAEMAKLFWLCAVDPAIETYGGPTPVVIFDSPAD